MLSDGVIIPSVSHTFSSFHQLIYRLGTKKLSFLSLKEQDEIRDHFGDGVGFYFSFLSHYTWWLFPIAICGGAMGILEGILTLENYRRLQCFWGMFVVLWSAAYTEFWRRSLPCLFSAFAFASAFASAFAYAVYIFDFSFYSCSLLLRFLILHF
jgi:hypothetical protein